ncbi:MAG TPA: DNA-protecting protein DprA, partial [Rhodospirillaceae bacterium]|nr:DNA-protecting protein DprA [Rhodospirillaceae bacterium]
MPDRLAHHRQRTLADDERIAWLRLIRSANVGPGTFFSLLERFGTAQRALDALPDLARRGGRAGTIRIATAAAASRELEDAHRIGATLLAWG